VKCSYIILRILVILYYETELLLKLTPESISIKKKVTGDVGSGTGMKYILGSGWQHYSVCRSRDVPAGRAVSSRGSGTVSPVDSLADFSPPHQQQQPVLVEVDSLLDFPALGPTTEESTAHPLAGK
jgi:hypothetical protein